MYLIRTGIESEHEALVPPDHRQAVHIVPQTGEVQEASFLFVLVPLLTD